MNNSDIRQRTRTFAEPLTPRAYTYAKSARATEMRVTGSIYTADL